MVSRDDDVGRGAAPEGRVFLGGTDGSNTVPSSGESTSRAILASHGEKPAFRAGVWARQVQRGKCNRPGGWVRSRTVSWETLQVQRVV